MHFIECVNDNEALSFCSSRPLNATSWKSFWITCLIGFCDSWVYDIVWNEHWSISSKYTLRYWVVSVYKWQCVRSSYCNFVTFSFSRRWSANMQNRIICKISNILFSTVPTRPMCKISQIQIIIYLDYPFNRKLS